jgi:hypothetical protein
MRLQMEGLATEVKLDNALCTAPVYPVEGHNSV